MNTQQILKNWWWDIMPVFSNSPVLCRDSDGALSRNAPGWIPSEALWRFDWSLDTCNEDGFINQHVERLILKASAANVLKFSNYTTKWSLSVPFALHHFTLSVRSHGYLLNVWKLKDARLTLREDVVHIEFNQYEVVPLEHKYVFETRKSQGSMWMNGRSLSADQIPKKYKNICNLCDWFNQDYHNYFVLMQGTHDRY